MFGIVLSLTAAFVPIVWSQHKLIEYTILEELQPETMIGNIQVDSEMAGKYEAAVLTTLRYSFLTQSSVNERLFVIEPTTGILKTAVRIDRDVICPGLDTCAVSLDIAVGPGQYFQVIPVRIEILDINDNSPAFSESAVSRYLSESSDPDDTVIPLPIPEDVDSPTNGIRDFNVTPPTPVFELRQRQSLDGTIDLELVLKRRLDREQTDFYQLTVVAYDGGEPPRSGSVVVNITVEDSNDNVPAFTQLDYVIQIPEDLLPEATILTVTAHDADVGDNGRVVYGLSRRTESLYGDLFGIRADSGDIYLKRIVDAEKVNVYNLVVTATDRGPGSRSTQAKVTIKVQDMNDKRPEIHVNTLTADGHGQISELSTLGTFVAHVSVVDEDIGQNGNVTCSLNDTNFDIQTIQENQYKIVTNNMFDREEREFYVIRISCEDHGLPPLSSVYELTVGVLDINDQSPVFNQTVYTATMYENNVIDEYVLRVNATDGDKGKNAEIRYSLDQPKPGYFRVIPETGVIRAAMSLDYEIVQKVEFKVIAVDRGQRPNSATAMVVVDIGDRNDEAPSFIQDMYSFGIYENQNPGTEVGVVNAYDPDSEQFSVIEFKLQADDPYVLNAFRIDKDTGQISTVQRLDRESIAIYKLRVLAYNPGFDLTGTASVTIYVADDNDHPPTVDFPNDINNTVTISNSVPFGYVVTRIRAHDEDIGNNGQLVFALIQGNEEGYFDMDSVTGAITTTEDLSHITNRTYNLSVEVMDHGQPPQTAITVIHINVDGSVPYLTHGGDEHGSSVGQSGSNSIIVIIVGCISGAVIVALIVAILAIRLQDIRRKEDRRYNCRMEAQKMLHGSNGDTGHQSSGHRAMTPTQCLYSHSSRYSGAGGHVLNNPTSAESPGAIPPGSRPEGNSSSLSFLEIGSLKKMGDTGDTDTRQHWKTGNGQNPKCSSSEPTNKDPCQASHGHSRPIREPFSSFSVMHSEIGQSSTNYGSGSPCGHSIQQSSAHCFPAHSAAINRSHLSPLTEDIQLQSVPWSERPLSLEHDSESACSGEVSNTDSGRGPSEEGEQVHNQHSNQQGNMIFDKSDPDNQERINKIGCHGNTGSTSDRKFCKQNNVWPQGGVPLTRAPNKSLPSTSLTRPIGHDHQQANITKPSGYRGEQISLPGWENVPIGVRQKPARPPRTDSLNRHHNSMTSHTSTTDVGDECSSSTSGSYIVDQEVPPPGGRYVEKPVCKITMGSSDV